MTGGIAPNRAGRVSPMAAKLTTRGEIDAHKEVTAAVHENGGKIAMQILHSGRYGYHPFNVAPSPIKAPIGWFTPRELSSSAVHATIRDYAQCAANARAAGYDGVEIMGSEGYLINQFIVEHTNKRTDEWGGSYANRIRFPVEVVKAVRAAVGTDFIIIYRLSMLDLIEKGSSWEEIVQLAKEIENAGATIINTGIGWHEARVPTIATSVPRAAFSWVTKKMMGEVSIPLITTNRINAPDVGDRIIAEGHAGAAEGCLRERCSCLSLWVVTHMCLPLVTRRHGLDGASVPRGPGVRAQGAGGARGRDQHVHRVQPGVSRPHVQGYHGELPREPALGLRNGAQLHAHREYV